MNHCRVLLSHQMGVQQALHLLRVHVLLLHVLTKLACMGLQHIHSSVVDLQINMLCTTFVVV